MRHNELQRISFANSCVRDPQDDDFDSLVQLPRLQRGVENGSSEWNDSRSMPGLSVLGRGYSRLVKTLKRPCDDL